MCSLTSGLQLFPNFKREKCEPQLLKSPVSTREILLMSPTLCMLKGLLILRGGNLPQTKWRVSVCMVTSALLSGESIP